MSLNVTNLVKHKDTVVAFARKSGNPLYARQLELYEEAIENYSKTLERLLMAVKLADSEELEKYILDAQEWDNMSMSEKQMHRIKLGIWQVGSAQKDYFGTR